MIGLDYIFIRGLYVAVYDLIMSSEAENALSDFEDVIEDFSCKYSCFETLCNRIKSCPDKYEFATPLTINNELVYGVCKKHANI